MLTKANDLDGDPLAITAVSATSAQGGSVLLGASDVTYTPATSFLGADSFSITIADGRGGNVNGAVNVTVSSLAPNAAAQPAIAVRPDGKPETLFYGTPGASYVIERNANLNNPLGWTSVATVSVGDDGVIPFLDPNPPAGKAFYRARPATP